MNLLSQWLWLGLLTLPAILLLHLLREKARRQPISSLELWRWLEKELRGPRLRRLPVTWILLLQLLAAAGLNLALARPQFTLPQVRPAQQNLILVIDISGSMAARDVPPSRLRQAQAGAAARLAALAETDTVTLITAGPTAQQVASVSGSEINDLAGRLTSLRAGGDGSDWAGALALAAAAIAPELNNHVVVYTDGAFPTTSAIEEISLPAQLELNLIGQPQGNQAVVTLAVRPSASGAVQVFARLANFADTPTQRTLTLSADGSTRDEVLVDMAASGVTEQAWTLPPGIRTVSVNLAGSDVLPTDDTAAVGVPGADTLKGVLVSAEPESEATLVLQRALRSLPNLEMTTVSPGNYAAFENYDLTVFHGWLPQAWPRGGVLIMDPPEGPGLLDVQAPVSAGEGLSAVGSDLLADVDLGHVEFGRLAPIDAPNWLTPVLTDGDGGGLIWHGATEGTRVVAFAFGLGSGNSNLARRTAFPVLVANAVAEVLPPPLPESISPGQPVELPAAQAVPFLTITDPAGSTHAFTGDRSALFTETYEQGLYLMEGQTLTGQPWNGGFGVNAGSALESDLRVSAQPVLSSLVEGGGAPPLEGTPPWNLWPWLVVLVLGIMVVEAALAWR